MRTRLSFTLVCSQCGDELECDTDPKAVKQGMAFPTRTHAEAVMTIRPCQHCIEEAGKPAKLLKEALLLVSKKEN